MCSLTTTFASPYLLGSFVNVLHARETLILICLESGEISTVSPSTISRCILGGPIDYTERLQYIGWMELKSRREFLSIIQLLKLIYIMVFRELSLTIIYRSLVLPLDQEKFFLI